MVDKGLCKINGLKTGNTAAVLYRVDVLLGHKVVTEYLRHSKHRFQITYPADLLSKLTAHKT